jgi:hypothetical protein
MAALESEIDHLYQAPLGEFTAARNALARRAGPRAADVRALPKPTLAAWAINQLFWKHRAVYDALVERAADLRATHAAALRGKRTDLRGASKAHDESMDAALKATLSLLANSGQPVTDATKQAIATTLRALPGTEPGGRLSRQLQPGGFEMLAAGAPSGRARAAAPRPEPPRRETRAISGEDRDRTAARLAAARDTAAASARATRDAEQVVRREQFEAARAVREAEKAGRRVEEAEAALKSAQQELAEAKREAAAAARAREAADRRARQAADALARARKAQAAAEEEVEKLR